MLAVYATRYEKKWKYKFSPDGPPSLTCEARENREGGLRGRALGSHRVPVSPEHGEVLGTGSVAWGGTRRRIQRREWFALKRKT